MGRKCMIRTAAEMEALKKRYWGPERNAARRARYHSDQTYRMNAIQQVRESARRAREEAGVDGRAEAYASNLANLASFGQVRQVHLGDNAWMAMLALTWGEFSTALGRNAQVIKRWVRAGMMPGPAVEARNARNRREPVYMLDEARALITVLAAHFQHSHYYREDHQDTRTRLFTAIAHLRAASGIAHDRSTNTGG